MEKVDILQPKTWVKFSPSLCRGCYAGCCTLPVVVTPEDLFHMGFIKAEQVNGPLKRLSQRLKKEGIIRTFRPKRRTFVLAQKNNHDCVFLDDRRRCMIYDRRPSVCRRFPENSIRPGFCPSQRKSKVRKMDR